MKVKLLSLVAGALSSIAGPALAVPMMVAGWDFSQYAGDSFPSLNGVDLVNTLNSNFSNLDPTDGAGAESAAFGTMYLNGLFGSTDTNFGDFLPSAANPGSLTSNLTAPGIAVPFDTQVVLQTEGQEAFNLLTMTALAASTVVFEADLTSVAGTGVGWSVTFGGRTSTGTSIVQVEVSLDGISFVGAGQANLTTNDTPFTFALGAGPSSKAYVRLGFVDPTSGQNTFLDNVSIHADVTIPTPEPSTMALLLAGLAGLIRFGRRRA